MGPLPFTSARRDLRRSRRICRPTPRDPRGRMRRTIGTAEHLPPMRGAGGARPVMGPGPRRPRSLMVTPGAQNLQPRCRECAEDLARVVIPEEDPPHGLSPTSSGMHRFGHHLGELLPGWGRSACGQSGRPSFLVTRAPATTRKTGTSSSAGPGISQRRKGRRRRHARAYTPPLYPLAPYANAPICSV